MDAVIETAVRKLGYREAKEFQIKSIKEFVFGKDVFVSVPTGYGKTVCYASLPLVFDTIHGHSFVFSFEFDNTEDNKLTDSNILPPF